MAHPLTELKNIGRDSGTIAKDTGFILGKEMAKHTQSSIRGISTGLGMGAGLYMMNYADGLSPNTPGAASGLYIFAALAGPVAYLMHRKKEDTNSVQKQMHPEKWVKNLYNTASEYVMTGIHFVAGAAAVGAAVVHEFPETAEKIDLTPPHDAELGILAGVVATGTLMTMTATALALKFVQNKLFPGNELENQMKGNEIALRDNRPRTPTKYNR